MGASDLFIEVWLLSFGRDSLWLFGKSFIILVVCGFFSGGFEGRVKCLGHDGVYEREG